MIDTLSDTFFTAVNDFKRANNGQAPAQVIVFRDGVSQGQFPTAKQVECKGIRDALDKAKCDATLSYIVVLKRHHHRFFPGREVDRSGNCMPGTIVDTQITHPLEFNFILQSHSGIQGMSRPTVYHVIMDEAKMGSDEIQKMCYHLCFLSGRATRSISVVAPSYRAHLAAYCIFLHSYNRCPNVYRRL